MWSFPPKTSLINFLSSPGRGSWRNVVLLSGEEVKLSKMSYSKFLMALGIPPLLLLGASLGLVPLLPFAERLDGSEEELGDMVASCFVNLVLYEKSELF